MANRSREDAEKQGNAEVGLGAAVGLGILAAIVGGVHSNNEKKKKETARTKAVAEIDIQISEINGLINDYQSKFMGSFLYSTEIDALKAERSRLLDEKQELLK